jgi:Tetratricopeptide repeat
LGVSEALGAPELQVTALAVGLVSLVQGLAGPDQLNELQRLVGFAAAHVPDVLDREEAARRNTLRRIGEAVRTLYGALDWVRPVQPDILGEHIVGEALSKAGPSILGTLLDQEPQERLYALVTLDRATRAIHDVHTRRTVIAALTEILPTMLSAVPDIVLVAKLTAVGELPRVLVGREALAASEEAVQFYRELVGRKRDAFLPDLASALNNMSAYLSNLGRRDEALAASEEAVQFYRELVGRNRDAFLPDLRDAFLPDLGSALSNLGNRFSNLGRRDEALAASEEAVQFYRELVGRNRFFLPDLASALNNMSAYLSNLGRRDEALAASEEAVSLKAACASSNRWWLKVEVEPEATRKRRS